MSTAVDFAPDYGSDEVATLYANVEVWAVLKIKMRFSRWLAELVTNLVSAQKTEASDEAMIRQALSAPGHEEEDSEMPKGKKQGDGADSEELCEDPDLLVDNPQKKLFCILCKQHGEREVTGRLIPFHINQFVHVNCALWTREVKETTDGELLNFYFA